MTLLLLAHIFCIDATFSENDVSKFTIFRPGLLPYSNIKRMTTILGFLGLVNLGLDALPSPKETESLSKKMEVEDKIDTFIKLNKE